MKRFMNVRLMNVGLLLLVMFLGMLYSQNIYAVNTIVGASAQCDTAISTCNLQFLNSIFLRCDGNTAPNVNKCPQNFSVDPTNALHILGNPSNGCVLSVDGGLTFVNCTTNPPSGGGTIGHYAITSVGTYLAMSNSGVNCIIGRSVDNAVSWSTVYNSTVAGNCVGDNRSSNIKCASGGSCLFYGRTSAGNQTVILVSTDDGQSWVSVFNTVGLYGLSGTTLYWDGTNGVILMDTAANTSLSTTSGSGGWAITPGALGTLGCYGGTFGLGLPIFICTPSNVIEEFYNVPGGVLIASSAADMLGGVLVRPLTFTKSGVVYVKTQKISSGCAIWATLTGSPLLQVINMPLCSNGGGDAVVAGSFVYISNGLGGANAQLHRLQ